MFRITSSFTLLLAVACSLDLIAQTPQILWDYELQDAAFGNAALADVDNDGYPEIVFSCYRNDSSVYMLNAEDGSLLWKYNTGGCNDVAPLIIDADGDGDLEVILPSSCVAKTFCLDADSGYVQWEAPTRGSDSPPTAGDVDNDGKLEILHGEFGGYVICLNAENGTQLWELPLDLNSWIQTAPALLDVDQNGQLDFVVANWSFGSNHRLWAVRADIPQILWTDTLPDDYMYHGAAFADLDQDGKAELTIGCYDGKVYCYNAEDGSLSWEYQFPSGSYYIGAPTSIGDLDSDGLPEVVFIDAWKVGVLEHNGTLKWSYTIPSLGQSFRGAALADLNSDDTLDVIFGTTTGKLFVLHGASGALLHSVDLSAHAGSSDFEIDHGPVVADFDLDGDLEVFIVGGHAEYPNIQNNWGRAYAVSFPGASAPYGIEPWSMFRHDVRRSATTWGLFVPVSSPDPEHADLVVSPNPSDGLVHFSWDGISDASLLRWWDLSGRLVGKHSVSVDESSFSVRLRPGCYIITLSDGERMHTRRAIVY